MGSSFQVMKESSQGGLDYIPNIVHGDGDGARINAKPTSHLSYMSQLDIDQVANNIRKTSIGCTLGLLISLKLSS